MSKLTVSIAAIVLTGCASMSEWRTLTIDSSSESAFRDSVTLLNDELPTVHREMFALALVDIANTGIETAGPSDDGSPAYTDADFRGDLDGLTYDDVIALADQTGMSVRLQHYYGGPRVVSAGLESFYVPNQSRQDFTTDGRPISSVRPYGADWATGTDGKGNAVYGNR
jgi:hypothetical protein